METCPAYISKINFIYKTKKKPGWHYVAVKQKLPALLHPVTSKNNSNSYSLNSLASFRTKTKLKFH